MSPQISSVHDGHDQAKLCLGLEGVGQGNDESTMNTSQNSFLHHGTLPERSGFPCQWNKELLIHFMLVLK